MTVTSCNKPDLRGACFAPVAPTAFHFAANKVIPTKNSLSAAFTPAEKQEHLVARLAGIGNHGEAMKFLPRQINKLFHAYSGCESLTRAGSDSGGRFQLFFASASIILLASFIV